jgi:Ca2+-binding RTX toxin-like protein
MAYSYFYGLPLTGSWNFKISSTGGIETVYGTSRNDEVGANDPFDTLVGGLGDDTYVVYSPTNKVIERAGEGIDTVRTWGDGFTLTDHVENLWLGGSYSSYGYGNSGNNIITGNTGNNLLNGYEGNDVLTGGAGNDIFVVARGAGSDIITDFTRSRAATSSGWTDHATPISHRSGPP